MITIFQVITMEGWVEIMYMIEDTSTNIITPAYFSLLVVIGSFFLLNLILAVIMRVFTQNDELERSKRRKKKILDETRKLRRGPKMLLKPLKVEKPVERCKSAKLIRKFSLLEIEEQNSLNEKPIVEVHSPGLRPNMLKPSSNNLNIEAKSPLELMKLNKTFIEKTPQKDDLEVSSGSSISKGSERVKPTK